MFAREGYLLIGGAAILSFLLVFAGMQLSSGWRVLLYILAAVALAFTLYFFRDPERTPPTNAKSLLLAPADGKVVAVVEEREPHYIDGMATRVSIFLSPLDVHVNRIPADGVIEFDRYVPGDYLVAWHPKASDKNERSELGLRHPSGMKVFFKQIAGAVARRIVYHVSEGDSVKAGERFGIVKFGSRMDVVVPPGVEISVNEGERVRAGESILGRFPDTPPADTDSSAIRQPTATS